MLEHRKISFGTKVIDCTCLTSSSVSPMYINFRRLTTRGVHELTINGYRLITITERETKLIKKFTIRLTFSQAVGNLSSDISTLSRRYKTIGSGKGVSAFPGSSNTRFFLLTVIHYRRPVEGRLEPGGCAVHLS